MANRKTGKVGFNQDVASLFTSDDRECMANIFDLGKWSEVRSYGPEILRRVRLDVSDSDHMPMGREWPVSHIDAFASWISEGSPKVRGETHSAYFRDLDAVTEYFDVYGRPPEDNLMPLVMQYFGRDDQPDRRKALNLWRDYALIPDDDSTKEQAKNELEAELANAEVLEAVKAVDAVLLDLVRKRWTFDGTLDREAMLKAFLLFGADELPEDVDRLRRIESLGNPNDFRLTYAKYHRMDSLIMWMNWMGHVECAVSLFGDSDADHGLRTEMLASLCLGYSADCVFRNRGQTRDEYYRPDGRARMWRKSASTADDFQEARIEAHTLSQLRVSQMDSLIASDQPIRFRDLL